MAPAFLKSLTPAGFRPRPEFFTDLKLDAADPQSFATRMAAFGQAHPEALDRRMKAFGERLEPLIKDATLNIERQFPNRWVNDPFAALADAKLHNRATFMVFSASWSGVSRDLDRTLSDPAVQKALDESFVAVRVDMTDDGAPAVKKAGDTNASHIDELSLPSDLSASLVEDEVHRNAIDPEFSRSFLKLSDH